jgi:hypothetical protein
MSEQNDTSFLEINRNRLDREWERQPMLYHEHAVNLADAKLALDDAESAFDVVRAEVMLDIYERPDAHGLDKATKDTVEAALALNKKVKAAKSAVHRAKHLVELTTAIVKGLDHKKRALESLVSLHGQDYFSEPRASAEDKKRIEDEGKRRVRRPLGKELDEEGGE